MTETSFLIKSTYCWDFKSLFKRSIVVQQTILPLVKNIDIISKSNKMEEFVFLKSEKTTGIIKKLKESLQKLVQTTNSKLSSYSVNDDINFLLKQLDNSSKNVVLLADILLGDSQSNNKKDNLINELRYLLKLFIKILTIIDLSTIENLLKLINKFKSSVNKIMDLSSNNDYNNLFDEHSTLFDQLKCFIFDICEDMNDIDRKNHLMNSIKRLEIYGSKMFTIAKELSLNELNNLPIKKLNATIRNSIRITIKQIKNCFKSSFHTSNHEWRDSFCQLNNLFLDSIKMIDQEKNELIKQDLLLNNLGQNINRIIEGVVQICSNDFVQLDNSSILIKWCLNLENSIKDISNNINDENIEKLNKIKEIIINVKKLTNIVVVDANVSFMMHAEEKSNYLMKETLENDKNFCISIHKFQNVIANFEKISISNCLISDLDSNCALIIQVLILLKDQSDLVVLIRSIYSSGIKSINVMKLFDLIDKQFKEHLKMFNVALCNLIDFDGFMYVYDVRALKYMSKLLVNYSSNKMEHFKINSKKLSCLMDVYFRMIESIVVDCQSRTFVDNLQSCLNSIENERKHQLNLCKKIYRLLKSTKITNLDAPYLIEQLLGHLNKIYSLSMELKTVINEEKKQSSQLIPKHSIIELPKNYNSIHKDSLNSYNQLKILGKLKLTFQLNYYTTKINNNDNFYFVGSIYSAINHFTLKNGLFLIVFNGYGDFIDCFSMVSFDFSNDSCTTKLNNFILNFSKDNFFIISSINIISSDIEKKLDIYKNCLESITNCEIPLNRNFILIAGKALKKHKMDKITEFTKNSFEYPHDFHEIIETPASLEGSIHLEVLTSNNTELVNQVYQNSIMSININGVEVSAHYKKNKIDGENKVASNYQMFNEFLIFVIDPCLFQIVYNIDHLQISNQLNKIDLFIHELHNIIHSMVHGYIVCISAPNGLEFLSQHKDFLLELGVIGSAFNNKCYSGILTSNKTNDCPAWLMQKIANDKASKKAFVSISLKKFSNIPEELILNNDSSIQNLKLDNLLNSQDQVKIKDLGKDLSEECRRLTNETSRWVPSDNEIIKTAKNICYHSKEIANHILDENRSKNIGVLLMNVSKIIENGKYLVAIIEILCSKCKSSVSIKKFEEFTKKLPLFLQQLYIVTRVQSIFKMHCKDRTIFGRNDGPMNLLYAAMNLTDTIIKLVITSHSIITEEKIHEIENYKFFWNVTYPEKKSLVDHNNELDTSRNPVKILCDAEVRLEELV